jgi:predicted HTH domain antitoxin
MKKEQLVAARLPDHLVAALRTIEEVEHTDRSTVVRKLLHRAVAEWKREQAAQRYGQGRITLERAAREADVSVREMMDWVRERKIPGQYDVRDLERDMAALYRGTVARRRAASTRARPSGDRRGTASRRAVRGGRSAATPRAP